MGRLEFFRSQIAEVGGIARAFSLVLLVFVVGCASPGPALPPSLNLPQVVSDLTVTRVGDEVRLRWTTPERTTDKLEIKGAISAEICRDAVAAPPVQASVRGCAAVMHLAMTPGVSEAWDRLPAGLVTGAARLLAYRVVLRNSVGRTAGASGAVYAAAGTAPAGVEGLKGTATKAGAMLEWRAVGGGGDSVELDRTIVPAAAQTTTAVPQPIVADATAASEKKRSAKEAAELRLRIGVDPGGAIDRTARMGESYRYTAQRVRTVVVGGLSVEMRSAASGNVTVEMLDVFPPDAPLGLVASPGFEGTTPTIDLSWEPGMEAGIAGYRVYRRDGAGGAWVRLNAALVAMPAYRDASVVGGRQYGYRVTAVDAKGNESGPSGEVVETAPVQ